jgi:pimeloyl-ACP methyl ester carboxylesterase
MKTNRLQIWPTAAIVAVVVLLWGVYFIEDPEKRSLDAAARSAAPGAFASLGDGYTHYELGSSAGADPARLVVLSAGFSVPYYIWDPTFKALTNAGFRVLRYDYYGRGYSDRPAIPFSDEMYVRQLDQLLNNLHLTMPIDLVGISFGGSLITSFADKYPDRVRSLIYFDPSIRRPYGLSLFEHMPLVWSYFTVLLDERFWADDQLGDFLHPERFPDWPKRYREQMQFKGFRRARLQEIATNAGVDQSDQLRRVGQHPRPVLVIWGKQDKNVPFEESEFVMDALPQGHLVAVDDSGHLPQWEQPDVVQAELIKFLTGGN